MTVINANCLDWMRTQPDNSIDCIVCDPPYALTGKSGKGGFMGKEWDSKLPSIEIWKEALRICKPGSWLLAFGGSRTYHRLTCSIEDAGWEIRDCILWMHGQGFPKGKGCLKPSYEPIILARKRAPKPELNIDICRIFGKKDSVPNPKFNSNTGKIYSMKCGEGRNGEMSDNSKGRWPANVILDEVAAELLDEMSGVSVSRSGGMSGEDPGMWKGKKNCERGGHSDSGGASRFFYCAKASSSERNAGLESELWLDNLELVLHNGTSFNLEELWAVGGQNQITITEKEASQEKDISEDMTKNLEDNGCCIISCGNSIEEQFPKVIKYTTSTGLKQTIELKTLSYYLQLNTNDCIQDVIKTQKENGINLVENVGLKNILKRIFTKEKMESLLGVKNAAKKMPCLINVKKELRKSNIHATVKPLKLMEYLIKLVAPKDGVILDPFCGSGSTLVAAKKLGYKAIGIELDPEYCKIAEARIAAQECQLELDL